MNDDFLNGLREQPRPEFAAALRERLRGQDGTAEPTALPFATPRARRVRASFVAVAAAAAFVALLAFPSVRVAAQGFLDIFRVKRIAAVPADMQRLARLDETFDMKTFAGDQVEVLVSPGPFQAVDSVGAAGDLAGFTVRVPAAVPRGFGEPSVRYRPRGAVRITADMKKVESLLQALAIEDVEVPWEANGAVFTVNAAPVVELVYRRGETSEMRLVQSPSPEIDLPPAVDLRRLGEIALRVYGLSAAEARTFSRNIDWSSTLVVPVPAMGTEYGEVDVDGVKGLLVTRAGSKGKDGSFRPRHATLIWSAGGRIYSLTGGGNSIELLQVAQSLR
jgi:hypothetical protein